MTPALPTVSIVIPTRNRRALLRRSLGALAAQSYPLAAMEAIVVADGCEDGTRDVAREAWPFAVRLIEQSAAGPAAARNRGAEAATGELLLFLDDDVEAGPSLVAAHAGAHGGGSRPRVAIGYLPPALQGRTDLFAIMLRAWWEAMFERLRDPGHRFAYSDLLSGNFSVERLLFGRTGGFEESLRCHEDYELGFRLIAAGAELVFVPAAVGTHHEFTDLARALRRKYDEGQADVALSRRHPGLVPVLPMSAPCTHLSRRGRALQRLAREAPALGDRVEACCRSYLRLLEGCRLRGRWRRLLDELLCYWYWRGVADAQGGASLEARASSQVPDAPLLDVDLRRGLDAAAWQLDALLPAAIRLRWGPLVIGTVPTRPGAEPLRGRHLRSLLRERFAVRLSEALLYDGLIADPPGQVPAQSERLLAGRQA